MYILVKHRCFHNHCKIAVDTHSVYWNGTCVILCCKVLCFNSKKISFHVLDSIAVDNIATLKSLHLRVLICFSQSNWVSCTQAVELAEFLTLLL